MIRRLRLMTVFTASILAAYAQNPLTHVQCAKHARQISSEEQMHLVVSRTPVVPPLMERLSIYGTVTLRVCVDTKGKVISAAVVDGHPMARQAVLESVQKWQFKPLRIDGHLEDVVSDLKVDYDFRAPAQGNGPSQ